MQDFVMLIEAEIDSLVEVKTTYNLHNLDQGWWVCCFKCSNRSYGMVGPVFHSRENAEDYADIHRLIHLLEKVEDASSN